MRFSDGLNRQELKALKARLEGIDAQLAAPGIAAAEDLTTATFYDDAYTRAAGALGAARSGQAWTAMGTHPPAYIKGGSDWVAGLTYGSTPAGAAEFFATTDDLGGTLLAGGGKFRIRASSPSTFGGNAIIGSWDGTTDVVPVHIVLTQYFYSVSPVDAGVQVPVTPERRPTPPTPYVNTPLKADGTTIYTVWWVLDPGAETLYVGLPDGTVIACVDEHFGPSFTEGATRPIFEGQTSAGTDALFEWLEVWASTSVPDNLALLAGGAP